MHLADQLYCAGLPVFPCRADKKPAVGKGEDWREVAKRQPSDSHWPSDLIGVPIPPGVVIIDLDTYKGVTREQAEQVIGCALPWDLALIQTTPQGGQHYGFRVLWDVRQGSDMGVDGLDTRVAGRGYICTGAGDGGAYVACGFGLFALAHPEALPRLPEAARSTLERVQAERPEHGQAQPSDADGETILQALRHVDPDCSRTEWLKIGLALRSHYGDDPEGEGFTLFDRWSAGELTAAGDCPASYAVDDQGHQWASFKADGATTLGSLFYAAIQGGWSPPPTLDTALAFGAGAVAADQFADMVDRLQEHGGDPKHTDSLIDGVRTLGGNQLQTATLLALLQRELKDAGLLTKPIRQQLDQAAGGVAISRAAGQYGKNHTENATLYVERYHPGGTLLRADQVWYAYDGRAWVEYSDDDLKCGVSLDMAPSLPQLSAISGTYGVLAHMCHARGRAIGDVDPALVLFQNGVLDLRTGSLLPHSPEYFTTNILPYDFNPTARCDQWLRFLAEVFEGDQERIELLQEWFGYMMSASYAYHKIMLLLGPPRCGKGTIGRMLAQLVGEQNFTGGSLHAFTSDSFLESLMTKTVVFSGDTAKRLAPATVDIVIEQVKKISGGDAIAFNRKWKSTISRTLPARITLASNHVPSLFDDSGALSGRLMALPFEVSFAGREDPGLFDRLLPDIEGVAAWALQGLARLNSVGRFTVPVASEVEAQFIRETYSPLQVFIADVCTIGEGKTGGDDLYDAYRAWAVTHQEDRILARRTFIGAFKDATRGTGCRYGPQRIDGHIVRGFSGLTVGKVDSMTAAAFAPQLVGK